jgi:hypothetical protein
MPTRIDNCTWRFKFQCPKRWEALSANRKRSDVRFCELCRQNIYRCQTDAEVVERTARGECVAFESDFGDMLLGIAIPTDDANGPTNDAT